MVTLYVPLSYLQIALILLRLIIIFITATIYKQMILAFVYLALSILNDVLYRLYMEEAQKELQVLLIGIDIIAFTIFFALFGWDIISLLILAIVFKYVMYSA